MSNDWKPSRFRNFLGDIGLIVQGLMVAPLLLFPWLCLIALLFMALGWSP